ncbi:MAG: hypothetical protein FWD57_17060, partial [Polyangiaceae bacterium]|nr:hypothetical protein [Polyangiaceae bacterium]
GSGGSGLDSEPGEGGSGGSGLDPEPGEGGSGGSGLDPEPGEGGSGGSGLDPEPGEGGSGGSGLDPEPGEGGSGSGSSGGTGGTGGGSAEVEHKLVLIVVSPSRSLVELDLNTSTDLVFSAKGRYLDGVDEDLTGLVNWSHSDSAVGSFSGSTLTVNPMAAAGAVSTRVTAEYGGKSGSAQLTIVSYRKSGPDQDFFFVLPYEDVDGVQERTLGFSTQPRNMDVFFNMDTTGSMGGAIQNLQNGLIGQIVNPMVAEYPSARFGVGHYADFPVAPFGNAHISPPDQPFELLRGISADISLVQQGVNALFPAGGGDLPEALIESLYQIATGEGLSGPGISYVAPNHSGAGGVGFRKGTMPIIVTITDAASHTVGETSACSRDTNYSACDVDNCADVALVAHTRNQAKSALNAICARSVGIDNSRDKVVGTCEDPRPDLVDFAKATGARIPPEAWDVPSRPDGCATGQCCTAEDGTGRAPDSDGLCPLVFKIARDGTGLGQAVVTGLQMLTRYATIEVLADIDGGGHSESGVDLPAGLNTGSFLLDLEPYSYVLPPQPPVVPSPTVGSSSFQNVTPGTRVLFRVKAYNDIVPQTDDPQFFRAVIRVLAGGCSELEQRDVIFLVPPRPLEVAGLGE